MLVEFDLGVQFFFFFQKEVCVLIISVPLFIYLD